MARIWITPEGKVHSTTREAEHLELASRLVKEYGFEPGRGKWNPSTDIDVLFKRGFVRFSDGNVEGKLAAIQNHLDAIGDFFQTELSRRGKAYRVYYDFIDKDGKRIASGTSVLGEISFWGPDDWENAHRNALREERSMERRMGLRRRPRDRDVRVRPYQRRQGPTKPL